MKLHSLIAAALLAFAADSHAGLIHQYELNGDLTDAKGGADLKKYGSTVGPSAYAFSANLGLELTYELGSMYTIDMRFQLDGYNTGSYQRLLDFKYADNRDNGLYVYSNDYCFYMRGCTGAGKFTPKQDIRLSVTRDAAALVTVYQNGKTLFSFSDNAGQANLSTPPGADTTKRLLSFFRDDGAGEAAKGSVDFIHLYDNALSAQQVAALHDADVPEPASLGLLGAGLALLGWTRRRQAGRAA